MYIKIYQRWSRTKDLVSQFCYLNNVKEIKICFYFPAYKFDAYFSTTWAFEIDLMLFYKTDSKVNNIIR